MLETALKLTASARSCSLAATLLLCACNSTGSLQQPVSTTPAPVAAASNPHLLDIQNAIQLDWKQLLQAPQLAQLINQAFKAHPAADDVNTTLLKADQFAAVHAGYFRFGLDITLNPKGQRQLLLTQASVANSPSPTAAGYGLETGKLNVSYRAETLHISPISLPRSRNELDMLRTEALYRTLASHVVAAALQESALRTQMIALRKITAIEQSLLASARKQLQAGLISQRGFEIQQTAAANSALALSSLRKQFEQAGDLLHLLLGASEEVQPTALLDFNILQTTRELPLEIPAALIEQRPDIRAAQLVMPTSGEQYQLIHAGILENTEAILKEIYYDNLGLKAAEASGQESAIALTEVRERYAANQASYHDLLANELDNQLAILQLTQARALQLGDAIMLYHALAGPWWTEPVSLKISHELHAAAEQ